MLYGKHVGPDYVIVEYNALYGTMIMIVQVLVLAVSFQSHSPLFYYNMYSSQHIWAPIIIIHFNNYNNIFPNYYLM